MSAAHHSAAPEFALAMESVARELLGEPNNRLSSKTELRFGTNGSKSVDLIKGVWHDHETEAKGGVLDLVKVSRNTDKAGAVAWLQERGHLPKPEQAGAVSRRQIAAYEYVSADGELLFQVIRFDPKDFRQRRPDGTGGWVWKMAGVQKVLYRLPELLDAVKNRQPVFIVEGEKAADTLAARGFVATCSPGGAGKWLKEYSSALTGADVVIFPDCDDAGRNHARLVHRAIRDIAGSVRVCELPHLPEKGDVADYFEQGRTADDLREYLDDYAEPEAAEPKRQRPKRAEASEHDPSKPTVRVVAGELHNTATEGEDAVIAAGLPIYQRGSTLVRPVVQDVPSSRGRMTVSAALHELGAHGLTDALCGCATWERFDGRAQDWVKINPPRNVADTILSRVGVWRVPRIVGVITTPTIRPDGSILSAPGYDAETRLFHAADPSVVLSDRVKQPTRDDALRALALLQGLLDEFPFVDDTEVTGGQFRRSVSRSVALSGLITPVVRGSLAVAPLHAFRANTAGTGKSYLVDIASAISSGRPCPVVAAGGDEAETEKRLTGLLLAGFPIASIDNVNGDLGGDLLCQAIERPFIRLRPLGRSEIMEIESRATLYATGNGLRVLGDMVRRTLVGDLDAGVERPELREFQKDPVATVVADRGRYVSACLAIVRAYILAGRPGVLPPIASFSDWSNTVRSALVWLGCDDPADSMEAAREDDPELTELREIIAVWKEALPIGQGMTCKQIIEWSDGRQQGEDEHGAGDWIWPDLRDMLMRVAGDRGTANTGRLGAKFRKHEGRIVGGYRIKRDTSIASPVAIWKLEAVKLK